MSSRELVGSMASVRSGGAVVHGEVVLMDVVRHQIRGSVDGAYRPFCNSASLNCMTRHVRMTTFAWSVQTVHERGKDARTTPSHSWNQIAACSFGTVYGLQHFELNDKIRSEWWNCVQLTRVNLRTGVWFH